MFIQTKCVFKIFCLTHRKQFLIQICSKVGPENIEDDFVTIYDGPNDQSTQLEKLRGSLGSFNITSNGNSLFVKLESDDDSHSNFGFFATIHHGNQYLISKSINISYGKVTVITIYM